MIKKNWKTFSGIFASILFIIVFAYFTTPVFTPQMENDQTEPFWVTDLDDDGRLIVFNLTLDHSTYADAITMLGNRTDLTIFHDQKGWQLEGYFRETKVGGFTGRVPFTLHANESTLQNVVQSINLEEHKKSTSEKKIYFIPQEYRQDFSNYIIHTVAFIPMAITLNENDIFNRFGSPEHIITEGESVWHYLYPQKGTDIAIDRSGKNSAVIQYINPSLFENNVFIPLKKKGTLIK